MLSSHLGPAGPIEQDIRGLQVTVDCTLAVQKRHAGAYVSEDATGDFLREGLGRSLQVRPQVATRQEFHDEDKPIVPTGHHAVDVHRLGAPEPRHRFQLPHECFALAALCIRPRGSVLIFS